MPTDPVPSLDANDLAAYLHRIDVDRPPRPDADGLVRLQRAHLRTVPFENLDIHIGRTIVLEHPAVLDKLLGQRRGGYCYELNGAFASLLTAIGYQVTILEAMVYGDGDVSIRFDHACLRVDLADGPRLVDVGFGASFDEPLLLATDVDQHDPAGTFRLHDRGDGWLDLLHDESPAYRLSLTPRALDEFEGGNHHQQTSPDSHFTKNTVCSMATDRGRVTLAGRQLIETIGAERTERELVPDEIAPVLADRFGIVLDAGAVSRLASAG